MPPQYTDLEPAEDVQPKSAPPMPYVRPDRQEPNKQKLPDLTTDNAYRTLQFFQENPQYLANPYTQKAAESVFGAASKVVGMGLQLERLNAKADAARAQGSTAGMVGKSLLKLAEGGGDGAKWAAKWYAPGDDGKPKYENPSNWDAILSGYEDRSIKKQGVDPIDVRLLETAQEYRNSGDLKHADMLEAIVTERGRNKGVADKMDRSVTVTETGSDGKKVTRKLTPEEAAAVPVPVDAATTKLLTEYAKQKAALLSGDKFASWEWLEIGDRARKLNELKIQIEQKGINPDTATRLTAPPTTGTTNAPASTTNAPVTIDAATARAILDEAGGDKEKARELARQRGYKF